MNSDMNKHRFLKVYCIKINIALHATVLQSLVSNVDSEIAIHLAGPVINIEHVSELSLIWFMKISVSFVMFIRFAHYNHAYAEEYVIPLLQYM